MFEIQIPFKIKGVKFKPEQTGMIKVDEVMIQTIASLCGWDGEARRLLTCALGGALNITSPRVDGITNKTSSGAAEDMTFTDQPTTEIMIMAHPTNTGDVWVNLDTVAAVDTGWYLDAGDYVVISINNMSRLNLHVVTTGDKVAILRTV